MAKRVNGKAKGNTFERKIANLLSERFAAHLGIPQAFRRNPDSGSFFGGSNTARTETHSMDYAIFGDLICPRNFRYSIECKHYKSAPTFQSIVELTVKQWDEWLGQAKQDSINSGKSLALIVKYNNVPEIVFLEANLTDLTPSLKYQGYNVYKLQDFLGLTDSHFFTE